MESKIIAIRKEDINLANEAFSELMAKTERSMNDFSRSNPSYFMGMSPSKLEDESCQMIKMACDDTPFNSDNVILVSGHAFPDIIAEKFYGVEVKCTKADHWKSIGSSIVESTRNELVENIYMLFGKLGSKPPEFKCRPYSDVLYDIAVTHSPRYLIDMELPNGETIFDKMNTNYDEFRTNDDNIAKVREYYKEKAKRERRQEMPWWISSEDVDKPVNFNLRLWNSVSAIEKKVLTAYCLILFPEIWDKRALNQRTKYQQACLWLCSFAQVLFPNMRDNFSASGKVTFVNGKRLPESSRYPHLVKTIVDAAPTIERLLQNPSIETMELIKEYNPHLLRGGNLYQSWLEDCISYSKTDGAPLLEWIETQPTIICKK